MTVEQELALMSKSLVAPKPVADANSSLQELKRSIESLKAVNPSLISDHLLKIVDTVEVANATNQRVEALADVIESLRIENSRLLADVGKLHVSLRSLEAAVKTQDAWFANFKLKSAGALQALEQYLRAH